MSEPSEPAEYDEQLVEYEYKRKLMELLSLPYKRAILGAQSMNHNQYHQASQTLAASDMESSSALASSGNDESFPETKNSRRSKKRGADGDVISISSDSSGSGTGGDTSLLIGSGDTNGSSRKRPKRGVNADEGSVTIDNNAGVATSIGSVSSPSSVAAGVVGVSDSWTSNTGAATDEDRARVSIPGGSSSTGRVKPMTQLGRQLIIEVNTRELHHRKEKRAMLRELLEQVHTLKSKDVELESTVVELKEAVETVSELTKELMKIKAQQESLKSQIKELEGQESSLRALQTSSLENIELLEKEKMDLQSSLDDLVQTNGKLAAQVKGLNDQVTAMNNANTNKLVEFQKAAETRETALLEANEALATAKFDVELYKKEITRLENGHKIKERIQNQVQIKGRDQLAAKQRSSKSLDDHECNKTDEEKIRESLESTFNKPTESVLWEDIIGNEQVKDELRILPISGNLPVYLLKSQHPKQKNLGILLYGPPGTGKSMFAKALATHTRGCFMNVSPTDIVDQYFGNTEKRMKAVLDMASEKSDESGRPTILFFDEVDGILGETDSMQDAARYDVIKIFQMWMQGFEYRSSSVIVVAATNHMEKLPQAVLSRFSKSILVDLPGKDDITNIIKQNLRARKVQSEISESEYQHLALRLQNGRASGRDVESLCDNTLDVIIIEDKEAQFWCQSKLLRAYVPCRHCEKSKCGRKRPSEVAICMRSSPPWSLRHFDAAIDKFGVTRTSV